MSGRVAPPGTRYADSRDGLSIAYQVQGEGELDVLMVLGPADHLEVLPEWPGARRLIVRLAAMGRLIRLDRRGTGLSDAYPRAPTLEQHADDLLAVLEATGSEHVVLLGFSEACRSAAVFAATHPERVTRLALFGGRVSGDENFAGTAGKMVLDALERGWGNSDLIPLFAPSRQGDSRFASWWSRYVRSACTPGMARSLLALSLQSDITDVLGAVRVPTLVLRRRGDRVTSDEQARLLAAGIPNAQFTELDGEDNFAGAGDVDALADEIEAFVTGVRPAPEPQRMLATVAFTDIVGSTELATRLGDRRWSELLDAHHELVRRELERQGGKEVKTTGDGFLATFTGPARAITWARAVRDAVHNIGLEVRAGLHAGEIELRPDQDIEGIGVHIAARVLEHAGSDEILCSSTVRELVVGSLIAFTPHGTHELKGVPGTWTIWAVDHDQS